MGPAIYVLGALTSLLCAFLLLRGYARSHTQLLLWSGLCFACFTLSNSLVFVDLVLFPKVDLYVFRLATAAIGMSLLVYGLIWGSD
jgi:hypothetical protein